MSICRAFIYGFDGCFDKFFVFRVKNVCECCDDDFHFAVAAFGLDDVDFLFADFGVCWRSSDFEFAFAAGEVVSSSAGFSAHSSALYDDHGARTRAVI